MYRKVEPRTINVVNVARDGNDNKKFFLLFTYDFGFELVVRLADNTEASYDKKTMTITYDPRRAVIKVNDKGYLTLFLN